MLTDDKDIGLGAASKVIRCHPPDCGTKRLNLSFSYLLCK